MLIKDNKNNIINIHKPVNTVNPETPSNIIHPPIYVPSWNGTSVRSICKYCSLKV